MELKFSAPCHFGLEKTLAYEAKKIGGTDISVSDGRVSFNGDERTLVRANMCFSVAERVEIVMAQFKAETFDELFDGAYGAPFERFIGKFDKFPVKGFCINSKLSSVPACQKIIKKALVKRLGEKYHTGFFQETDTLYKVCFSIIKNEVTLMLDTSGEGLHKRGYRRYSGGAPIKETLAAGIIDLARIRDTDIICDPFCGSGTILIESALKALNIPPCLDRSFSAMEWDIIPKRLWAEEREALKAAIKTDVGFKAVGFDNDADMVKLTIANCAKAGVEKYVSAELRDIADFSYPDGCTKLITNPPYGERLLEQDAAREIYGIMGKKMFPKNNTGIFVITSDTEFETLMGKKADKNRKLYNGMLMCRLYSYL